jgi:DNA-binding winged helix-turn-helix (wHTH) protein
MSAVIEASAFADELLFGPFRLLAGDGRLFRGDTPIPLGSRARQILLTLVGRAGAIVSKSELNVCVWPSMVMEDATLRVHVASLRKALGDSGPDAVYIQNVPGRGYRFIAPVSAQPLPTLTGTAWCLEQQPPRTLPHTAAATLCFGPYRLLPEPALLREDERVCVGSRALKLLALLTEKPGQLVTKRSLMTRVWADTRVAEAALRFQVASLRKILGGDSGDTRYIQTISGVGYRFVAPTTRTCKSLREFFARSLIIAPSSSTGRKR